MHAAPGANRYRPGPAAGAHASKSLNTIGMRPWAPGPGEETGTQQQQARPKPLSIRGPGKLEELITAGAAHA